MDIEHILEILRINYPVLHRRVMEENLYFQQTKEERICGAISGKIEAFLKATFPEWQNRFIYCSGKYVGNGTEHSGGSEGTYHCWVEIILPNNHDKIIIDGSYAQFYPSDIPQEEKERLRLRIFMPEEKEQTWYKGHFDDDS